jgi:hypothetical protein
MLKKSYEHDKRYFVGKILVSISLSFSLRRFQMSLLVISREVWSTMIRTQVEKHNGSEMVGMYGRLVLLNILEIPYITTVDDTD